MSTEAIRIRDAIKERLDVLTVSAGIRKLRTVPVMMLQPDDLPAITVSLLSERMTPNGDDSAGAPRFDSEVTIGISIVRGAEMPVTLDGQADSDVGLIEQLLLCDPSFTRFGPDPQFPKGDPRREPLFEAVTGISRRRLYPQSGEIYLVETRVEMSFRTSVDFDPIIPDELRKIALTARPIGADEHTPSTGAEIIYETTTP